MLLPAALQLVPFPPPPTHPTSPLSALNRSSLHSLLHSLLPLFSAPPLFPANLSSSLHFLSPPPQSCLFSFSSLPLSYQLLSLLPVPLLSFFHSTHLPFFSPPLPCLGPRCLLFSRMQTKGLACPCPALPKFLELGTCLMAEGSGTQAPGQGPPINIQFLRAQYEGLRRQQKTQAHLMVFPKGRAGQVLGRRRELLWVEPDD